jgi:transcriptional regulator with XRE-family HTH domain
MNYRTILRDELLRRKQANPSYSLRAFSRQLNMSPAQLSQIISGKRPLSAKKAYRIAESLNFSPTEKSLLVESTIPIGASSGDQEPIEIRDEEFQLVSDWYHFAILSLTELPHHKADPRWIARQLGVTPQEAADALARLVRLKIVEVKKGKMTQIMKPIRTTTDVSSSAIRRYHLQNLENSKEKLGTVPVEKREYSAITMAVSTKNLPKAKRLITEFKRKLADIMENGSKDAVYTLAVQLFPVSKVEEK